MPFATVRTTRMAWCSDRRGSSNLDRWAWPEGRAAAPDGARRMGARSGYTWRARSAIRTAANTEAKLLMLRYAFETWESVSSVFSHRCAQCAIAGGD